MNDVSSHLTFLYGVDRAPQLLERLAQIIRAHRPYLPARAGRLTERDAVLITYGDQVQADGQRPLQTLRAFCEQFLSEGVSAIHILPFYPWTSDDGFSVVDYRAVDPALGTWEDVGALQAHFDLMFDAVINHISAHSAWFQGFLQDDPRYRDFFITVKDAPDLSQVVRPRALPLLTTVQTAVGEKQVWTTFSADQVDLNYKNPEVLLELIDILLTYVQRGATFIRLDAIAYLWKELDTPCIHLPQTHRIIRLLRAVLDEAAPHVQLITETNVRHVDNISYFGDGTNEAQLVYNFALPPLTLHTFHTGDARVLSDWARTLSLPSDRTTFFNFLASHDGIGLNPARGLLSDSEVEALVGRALAHGGLVSFKQNPDGTQSPYELNINYFDALSNPFALEPPASAVGVFPKAGSELLELQVNRFIAAQAIMLALVGVPGIYFHSLFGSRGWPEGAQRTGRNRTINREKLAAEGLRAELADEYSLRSKVHRAYRALLTARRRTPAFDPHGTQVIRDVHPAVFALERASPDGTSRVLCLHNVSEQALSFDTEYRSGVRLLEPGLVELGRITLQPYEVLWVTL